MPKSFLARGAGLAAVAAALSLGATGVADASLVKAYDFNGGSLQASFDSTNTSRPPLQGVSTPNGTFDGSLGQGYILNPNGTTPAIWSLSMTVDLDQVDPNGGTAGGWTRILNPSGANGQDAGLYLHDGKLAWRDSAGLVDEEASGALTTDAEEITVVRNGATLTVYRGNDVAFTASSPANADLTAPNLFIDGDPSDRDVAGDMKRLRLFSHALTAGEVQDLRPLDIDTPTGEILVDGFSEGSFFDGSTLWQGRHAYFPVQGNDDGTGPLDITGSVFSGSNPVASAMGSPFGWATEDDNESINTDTGQSFDLGSLSDGGEYTYKASLADRAGHSINLERAFRVDKTPPSGLTIDTPAQTDDRTPAIGGSAVVGARDRSFAGATICKGDSCYDGGDYDEWVKDYVGYVEADIVNGKWGSSEIKRHDLMRGGEPKPVGDLPLGTYRVVAYHSDNLSNYAEVEKTINVVAPAAPLPANPVVVTPAPTLLAPAALLLRNRQSIFASLLKERLRGLTKDGKAVVDVFMDRPGDVIVQLFDGTAPKKVDPKAKAAQKKRKKAKKKKAASKLIAAGKRTFAAPGTGKLTVKLTKRGKSLLRKKKSRRISVRTIIVPRGGAPIADTQKLTIKR